MSRLRLVSWNIRAGGGKRISGITRQLLDWRPAIIGLCEFRGTAASQWLARTLADAGYGHQIDATNAAAPAANALLLASRFALKPVHAAGMPEHPQRWLLARVQTTPSVVIGQMHVPNYTAPRLKYPFLDAVLDLAQGWRRGPALFVGDSNCGSFGIDDESDGLAKFQREHDFMEGMAARGWADGFRHLHGDRREYTWYSHRNNGFRLDQGFCSSRLIPALTSVRHAWGVDPGDPDRRSALSDHAALIFDFDLARL